VTDLKAFTRGRAGPMESDLGTRLDWVGIAHRLPWRAASQMTVPIWSSRG
jgi:hypothetical protein